MKDRLGAIVILLNCHTADTLIVAFVAVGVILVVIKIIGVVIVNEAVASVAVVIMLFIAVFAKRRLLIPGVVVAVYAAVAVCTSCCFSVETVRAKGVSVKIETLVFGKRIVADTVGAGGNFGGGGVDGTVIGHGKSPLKIVLYTLAAG